MLFIQALGGLQRLVRRKPEHFIGVPLQAGQVIQLGRRFLFPGRFRLDHRTCFVFYRFRDRFCVFLLLQVGVRVQLIRKVYAAVIAEIGCQRAEAFRFEVLDLFPPLHQDCQRRCLDPADGKERIVFQCKRPACVHAHQPVRLASAPGALIQSVVIRAGPDIPEAFGNRFVCHGRDPEALEGLFAAGFFIDIPEDQFAFPPCVCGADQRIRFLVVDQFFDLAVLVFRLGDNLQRDRLRQDRQRGKGPFFILRVNLVRFHQRDQVAHRPGDDILLPDQAAVPAGPAAQHPGNIPAHAGLFSHHNDLSHAAPPFLIFYHTSLLLPIKTASRGRLFITGYILSSRLPSCMRPPLPDPLREALPSSDPHTGR